LDYPQFREHLQSSLSEPDPSLEAVHSIFAAGLRHHLKNEHCTPRVSDLPSTITMKSILSNMFMEGEPTPSILDFYLSDLEGRVSETEVARFVAAMQKTKTPEDRARLYVLYYCSTSPNDPPVLRDFKQKYARIFEALVPHDEVLAAMRKEAQEYQAKNMQQLEERLSALELGKKAHLKKEQRKNARNGGDVIEQVVNCSLEGCPIEVNLMTEEVIECVVCEWMAEKGGMDGERRERAVYCSVEHAEDDFVSISSRQPISFPLTINRKRTNTTHTVVVCEIAACTTPLSALLSRQSLTQHADYATIACLTATSLTSAQQNVTSTIWIFTVTTSCKGISGSIIMMMPWRSSGQPRTWRS